MWLGGAFFGQNNVGHRPTEHNRNHNEPLPGTMMMAGAEGSDSSTEPELSEAQIQAGRPLLNCVVAGTKVLAFLDSGRGHLGHLGPKGIKGRATLEFKFSRACKCRHSVFVVDDDTRFPAEVLIGVDLLRRFNFKLNLSPVSGASSASFNEVRLGVSFSGAGTGVNPPMTFAHGLNDFGYNMDEFEVFLVCSFENEELPSSAGAVGVPRVDLAHLSSVQREQLVQIAAIADLDSPLLQPDLVERHQRDDPLWQQLIEYLEEGRLPPRRIPLPLDQFELRDRVLYHVKSNNERAMLQLVIPRSLCGAALDAVHAVPSAGHQGVHRTYQRLRDHFYFPGMLAASRRYVASCTACQRRKGRSPELPYSPCRTSRALRAGVRGYPHSYPFGAWKQIRPCAD
ncbi:putative paraneoplastic antigen Ma1 [Penaeus vannamei]|uniref:RNA-directed DNA polymerase n=1 Tax=Penaeus vannamei TaxID=6689 RepID=A0A3R7ML43_PENVA|nr:putative paraneoplastic antigen Ma1 [Penaeus vannamei]